MRHKQILDAATENPDASLAELAAEVPSATTDLVEHVLEEHGDPGRDDTDTTESPPESETGDHTDVVDQTDEREPVAETTSDETPEQQPTDDSEPAQQTDNGETPADRTDGDNGTTDSEDQPSENPPVEESTNETTQREFPSPDELTKKQRTTLREIAESPEATQQELADALDVSAPTISNRVNSIEGFDWSNRQAFVETVLDTDSRATQEERMSSTDSELDTKVAELEERLSTIEQQLEESATGEPATTVFEDAELTHKVVHACMQAETISEDEELRLLEELLQ
jgi:DNA-binding CsgD family transcriptional regulator